MKKIYTTIKILSFIIIQLSMFWVNANAQTMMPLPAHSTVYSGTYARGYNFIAPCDFTITGLKVAPEAGTGSQYIHIMKCLTPFPVATTGSNNFTTLAYISGATNNTVVNVNIQVHTGEAICILGTVTGICNSYAAAAVVTTTINGFSVYLNRAGFQGSIESGPAATYWGDGNNTSGQIGRVFMYYSTTSGYNNAAVLGVVEPNNFCTGTYPVKAKIGNKGKNTITSLNVNWEVNSVAQTTLTWTGLLDTVGGVAGPSDTIVTLGSLFFPSGLSKNIKVWTSLPNLIADTLNTDDTINVTKKPALSGSFTIGGVAPDYPTIADAAADLTNNGICGPVVFNIRTGTYSGQMSLGLVSGSSPINTIRFQSAANHVDSVNLSYTATAAADNFIVKLNGTKFISFNNLKFSSNTVTFSRIFDITGGCQFDTIQNCSLLSATATASSANTAVIYTDGSTNTSLVVLNNVISGGSYGLRLYGSSTALKVVGALIQGNQFINQYIYGIYSYYHQNSKIRNNIFTSNTTTNYYGIFSYYADSATEITGNRISGISVGYGIHIFYCYGSQAQPAIIANNIIQIGGTGLARGINSNYASSNRIYHNSVNISSSSATTGYAGYFYYSATTYNNNEVKNNIFSNSGGGYAVYNYNPTLAGTNNIFDYNNLYTSGTVLGQIGTPASTPANIALWKTATQQDQNSISYRPGFTSVSNLVPNPLDTACWSINGRGTIQTLISPDINNVSRPLNKINGVPDIGAYEFTPSTYPPAATMVAGPIVTGFTNQVYLFGGDTIAKFSFDNSYSTPTFMHVRRRVGVAPPNMGASPVNYMYCYDSVYAPMATYSYSMELKYKDQWLGTMTNEGNMTIIKNTNPPITSWTLAAFTTTVDSTRNAITATNLVDFGLFAGTDVINPLPVKLVSLTAVSNAKTIAVNWVTASEINSSVFVVERSVDGKSFESIAKVKAAGNSGNFLKYGIDDEKGKTLLASGVVYYRLHMIDIDGKKEYSKVVAVKESSKPEFKAEIFPNPFTDQIMLKIDNLEEAEVKVEIIDLNGQQIYSSIFTGSNQIINNLGIFPSGVYFVRVSSADEIKFLRLLKQ